jgi:hypothetical protein
MDTMEVVQYKIPDEVKNKIVEYLKKNPPEFYWDYRQECDVKQLNEILTEKDGLLDFENELLDMNLDYVFELEHDALENAFNSLSDEDKLACCNPDDNVEDVEEIDFNERYEDLRDEFLDYLIVDVRAEELIRKSGDQVFFYSTGVDVGGWGEKKESFRTVKKALKIAMRDKTWDKEINELVCNASYGGSLVIAFSSGLEEWMYSAEQPKMLIFRNPEVVIVDHLNGSGHNVYLKGFSIKLPFVKDNLYLDCAVKYSYTDDICGMSNDWCNGTDLQLGYKKTKAKIHPSAISEHMAKQAQYDKTYKEGKCTFGDMDIHRHRDSFYDNNFPCGTHCPHCGTFWID